MALAARNRHNLVLHNKVIDVRGQRSFCESSSIGRKNAKVNRAIVDCQSADGCAVIPEPVIKCPAARVRCVRIPRVISNYITLDAAYALVNDLVRQLMDREERIYGLGAF